MFEETKVHAKTSHHYARLHRESIEIHKHENDFNEKEENLKLNKTWFPALKNRKINKRICNQTGIAKCRTTANETPGRHRSNDVTDAISTETSACHRCRRNIRNL
jgi:hypothetical protein